jgi:hypothetical protein
MAINPILLAETIGIQEAVSILPDDRPNRPQLPGGTWPPLPPVVNNSPNNPPPGTSNVPPQQRTSEPVNPRPNTTITDTSVRALNSTVTQPNVLENIPSISDASAFTIKFVDTSNVEQIYRFSLLPAIESKLASGSQVPEVKPGILIKTSMNIKRFLVPGGAPMFQMLGAEQTILQLVGLLIGNESLTPTNTAGSIVNSGQNPDSNTTVSNQNPNTSILNTNVIDPASSLYKEDSELNSHAVAKQLDLNVVQLGRPVEIRIISHNSDPKVKPFELKYNCLLQSFRYFVARNDRTYYALDAIVLDYLTVTTNNQRPFKGPIDTRVNEQRPFLGPVDTRVNGPVDTRANNDEDKEVRQSA